MAENNETAGAKPAGTARARKEATPKAAKPKASTAKAGGGTGSGSPGGNGTAAAAAASASAAAAAGSGSDAGATPRAAARSRFNAAMEEARAGVAALRTDATERTAAYRRTAADSAADWVEDARGMTEQARRRAAEVAREGKTRASDGIAALGRTVSDTATTIDERLGPQYGDYARNAARSLQEAAAKLDAKDIAEIGEDAREFVRKSPGTAIGIAAVTGYFLARLFRGSDD
jgi:ElaB/YqjD/DUF883 family membrane-anchored ribosome-binding protein